MACRLREENTALSAEVLSKVTQMEKDKSELLVQQLQRQTEWDREKEKEIDRLREIHRCVYGQAGMGKVELVVQAHMGEL